MSTDLPGELSYLQPSAAMVGAAWRFWSKAGRVARNGSVWQMLAQVHHRICRQEDGMIIAQWLAQPLDTPVARDLQHQVRGLLHLLRALGLAKVAPFHEPVLPPMRKRGVRPRSTGELRQQMKGTAAGDDAMAMRRLRTLLKRARAMGIEPRWQSLADFIDAVDEPKFNALCLMVHRMRRQGQDRQLRRCIDQKSIESRRDLAMARSLMHVIDALEIF